VDPQLREELKRLSLVVITGTTMLHKPIASPPLPPPPSLQQGIHSFIRESIMSVIDQQPLTLSNHVSITLWPNKTQRGVQRHGGASTRTRRRA
jgi:hypothetical protein